MALNGIDISDYQRGLDLDVVPCDFVICKATEGTNIVHNTCDTWIQDCKRLGKLWGFYHFLAGGDPVAEADFFVDNTINYFGEGVPVLDYEMYGRIGTAGAKRFLDRVYERTGVRCVVYMSRSVCNEEDWSQIAPNHALWVAQYANNKPTGYQSDPWFPAGSIGAFKFVTIHQYTSTGRLSGYNGNLDLDIAYLDRDGWMRIAKGDRKEDVAEPKPDPEPEAPQTPLPEALEHYVDIDGDAWFVKPIENVVRNGWMKGYDDTHFGPTDPITRGQAVCVLANYAKADVSSPFSDVVASPFYYEAIEWAKENGIIYGNNDMFRPDDPCTREEFMVMLHNLSGNPEMTSYPTTYPDWVNVSDWAKEAVAWCIQHAVINGSGGNINPTVACSRAEAAAMISNYDMTKNE